VNAGSGDDIVKIKHGGSHELMGGAGNDKLYGSYGDEIFNYNYAGNETSTDQYFAGSGSDALILHFDYAAFELLADDQGFSTTDDYLQGIEDEFETGHFASFADLGFDLTAKGFETIEIDVTGSSVI
jgi:hypothetical protein